MLSHIAAGIEVGIPTIAGDQRLRPGAGGNQAATALPVCECNLAGIPVPIIDIDHPARCTCPRRLSRHACCDGVDLLHNGWIGKIGGDGGGRIGFVHGVLSRAATGVEVGIAAVAGRQRLQPGAGGDQAASALTVRERYLAGVPVSIAYIDCSAGHTRPRRLGGHTCCDRVRLPHYGWIGKIGGDGGGRIGFVYRMLRRIAAGIEAGIAAVAGGQCLRARVGGNQAANPQPVRKCHLAGVALPIIDIDDPARCTCAGCLSRHTCRDGVGLSYHRGVGKIGGDSGDCVEFIHDMFCCAAAEVEVVIAAVAGGQRLRAGAGGNQTANPQPVREHHLADVPISIVHIDRPTGRTRLRYLGGHAYRDRVGLP